MKKLLLGIIAINLTFISANLALREKGLSIRKIADQLDINRGVVLKICQSNQV